MYCYPLASLATYTHMYVFSLTEMNTHHALALNHSEAMASHACDHCREHPRVIAVRCATIRIRRTASFGRAVCSAAYSEYSAGQRGIQCRAQARYLPGIQPSVDHMAQHKRLLLSRSPRLRPSWTLGGRRDRGISRPSGLEGYLPMPYGVVSIAC